MLLLSQNPPRCQASKRGPSENQSQGNIQLFLIRSQQCWKTKIEHPHKYCNARSQVLLLGSDLSLALGWTLRTHLGMATMGTCDYLTKVLAWTSTATRWHPKQRRTPGFHRSWQGCLQPAMLATISECYNPTTDSLTYLGLRSTRKCNFGVNLGETKEKPESVKCFVERRKYIMSHLIINHSFLRLIL